MQRNTGYFPTESLEPCGNRLFSRSALNEGYLFRGSLVLQSKGVKVCLAISDIFYLEVLSHQLVYYTKKGQFNVYGTMAEAATILEPLGFSQCNNCYLVNLRYVRWVHRNTVNVQGQELQISYPRKKTFMEALNQYIGG